MYEPLEGAVERRHINDEVYPCYHQQARQIKQCREAARHGLARAPAPHAPRAARQQYQRRQDEQRIQKALTALTPEQREAILLSRYQGLSYAEIAQISGCSEGAVKTRVFRAMETLKKALTGDASGGERCLNAIS